MSYNDEISETYENAGAGVLGALLLSLIGGIVFVGLFWIDIFAPLAGIITVVLAIIGFRLFAKKPSLKSVFISLAVALVVMAVADYFTLALDAYRAYADWYSTGDVDSPITFAQAVLYGYQFLADPAVLSYYLKQFGFSVLFCIAGSSIFIVDGVKLYKQQKEY